MWVRLFHPILYATLVLLLFILLYWIESDAHHASVLAVSTKSKVESPIAMKTESVSSSVTLARPLLGFAIPTRVYLMVTLVALLVIVAAIVYLVVWFTAPTGAAEYFDPAIEMKPEEPSNDIETPATEEPEEGPSFGETWWIYVVSFAAVVVLLIIAFVLSKHPPFRNVVCPTKFGYVGAIDNTSVVGDGLVVQSVSIEYVKGKILLKRTDFEIYEATIEETGDMFTLIVYTDMPSQSDLFKTKVSLLAERIPSHQNIIEMPKFYGVVQEQYHILTEPFTILIKSCGNIRELKHLAYIAESLLSALAHLDNHGIIHRDIRPINIGITNNGTIKLLNFSLAPQTANSVEQIDAKLYMAPEVMEADSSNPHDSKADVFSLGMTLLIFFAKESQVSGLRDNVINKKYPEPPWGGKDVEWNDFIGSLLQVDPATRPRASELLNHKFLEKKCTKEEFTTFVSNAGYFSRHFIKEFH